MTSTMRWLETYSGAGAAISMVVEGSPYIFSTDTNTDTGGVIDAFGDAGAPYADFTAFGGAIRVGGKIGSEIELYTPDIKPETIDITVVDILGVMIGQILREGSTSGFRTYLTSSVAAGSTASINVKDTTGAAASGTIYIGGEAIAYTGKTATTFTGITRGVLTINATSSGAAFAPGHLIGNNVSVGATTSPAVSDYPRTWVGRFVHVFMHIKNPLTGAYNTASEATKIWSGRIASYADNRDGSITISAKAATDLLYRPIGPDQWRARVGEGMTLDAVTGEFRVQRQGTYTTPSVTLTAGRKTHAELAALLNAQFETWRAAATTSTDAWNIYLADGEGGKPPTYRIRVSRAAIGGQTLAVYLHSAVWTVMGWGDFNYQGVYGIPLKEVFDAAGAYAGYYELVAPVPPAVYYHVNLGDGYRTAVTHETNTFITQASMDPGHPDVNCVVEIKGGRFGEPAIYAAEYTAGSPSTLWTRGKLDLETGTFRYFGFFPGSSADNGYVRLGDATEAPEIRQVLLYRGQAGALLLRAALSTGGASGYNHADYDTDTIAGFGASIPASLIDVESWEALDDVHLLMVIADPRPLYEYLEQVLAISNRYVVWKAQSADSQPKLAIVQPSLDTAFQATWQLTESNKAGKLPDRVRAERSADGVINRIVVQYGQGASKAEGSRNSVTIENLASQGDYGRRRTVTISAPNVMNAPDVLAHSMSPALAYFSRPLATVERSINASLLRMAPGDSVTLTDNYLVDPATGTRGAQVYCWCLGTSFDLATGLGEARLVFLPEKNANYTGLWAPSARVDETAATAGYVAGTKTLTLKASEYSTAGAVTNDRQQFNADDYVHIYALDESPPLEWFDRIASCPTSTTVVLVTGLAGWDTAKRYVMEYDDITTSSNSGQRNHAFLADATTLSTGFATPTPYEWGQSAAHGVVSDRDYTKPMFRPNTTYDDQGEPASIHKLVDAVRAANNMLKYKTRQTLLTEPFRLDQAVTGTTPTLLFHAWCPFFGNPNLDDRRLLIVKLRVKQAGGGTAYFEAAASATLPKCAGTTGYTWPAGANMALYNTTSTSFVWTGELLVYPQFFQSQGNGSADGGPPATYVMGAAGTWITIIGYGSAGGVTATLNSVQVVEAV